MYYNTVLMTVKKEAVTLRFSKINFLNAAASITYFTSMELSVTKVQSFVSK